MENNQLFYSALHVLAISLCFYEYSKIKKTPAAFTAGVKFNKYYLCFLSLNFPPLISFSIKAPDASPTSVNSTLDAPS